MLQQGEPPTPCAGRQGHTRRGGGNAAGQGAHAAGRAMPGHGGAAAGSSGPGPYQASRAFLVSGQAQQGFSGFFSSRASAAPLPSQLAAATEDMAGSSRLPQPAGRTGRRRPCERGWFREAAAAAGKPRPPLPGPRPAGRGRGASSPRLFVAVRAAGGAAQRRGASDIFQGYSVMNEPEGTEGDGSGEEK